MASKSTNLPDDTDTITAGASGGSHNSGAGSSRSDAAPGNVVEKLRTQAADIGSQASAKVGELRGQATDQAFAFAAQGKDRASEALDGAAKLISDAADQVEERLGSTAGGYARQAADAVSGFATTIRSKDVDDLVDDARVFIQRSPALAVGAAAAAGFLISRVIRAGSTTLEGAAHALDTTKRTDVSRPATGADDSKA